MKSLSLFLSAFLTLSAAGQAFELSPQTRQAIVGIAADWNSSHVRLHLYERNSRGAWRLVGEAWQGRLGKNGLAWGRGVHPAPSGVRMKKEGDRRAPAGVFTLGDAWGYSASTSHHPRLRYNIITPRDLWVEDTQSRFYNQHIRLNHLPQTTWEKKAQMRQNDAAHAIKYFIHHNVHPKPVPGAGSSIFFHIWRGGGSKATFGCTTMSRKRLIELLKWVNPQKHPVYILLPQKEYMSKRLSWKLP